MREVYTCNIALNFISRYVRKNWLRVVEAMIVSVMSATSAFALIYFYDDCKPIGAANITRPLQVHIAFLPFLMMKRFCLMIISFSRLQSFPSFSSI